MFKKTQEIAPIKWPSDKPERRSTASLIPYARNSRTHSAEQIAQIAASIKEWGFTNPILIDAAGGIIAGHGRLLAAQKLGIEEVPCIIAEGWTDAQKKAYVIADNKLAMNAGWDNDMLAVEFGELKELGFDLPLTGFSDDEIAALSPQIVEGLTDEDAVPEAPSIPKTVLGDVWLLGNHRLMCGDSTSIDAVEKLMDGQKADMVFTDPPYNTGMTAKTQTGESKRFSKGKSGDWLGHMFDDDFSPEQWQSLLSGMVASMWAVMKDDSVAYVCLDWRRSHELVPHLKSVFKFSNLIIWDKMVHGLGSDYKYTHEFIHVCKKGKPALDTHQGDREYQDVWRIQRKIGRDDDHATKKPLEIPERAIRHSVKTGSFVLDLFGGSGSTLIACEKNGRHARLMELDEKYCDVIVKRWQDFTGKQATHAETGVAFNDA